MVGTTAPFARKGESTMSGAGFRFGKAMAALGRDAFLTLRKSENWTGVRPTTLPGSANRPVTGEATTRLCFCRLAWKHSQMILFTQDEDDELKSLLHAGVDGADAGEIASYQKKYGTKAAVSPALSSIDQSVGGAFVPPAMFGPPIELFRSAETLFKIATIVPLGPAGSPRIPEADRRYHWWLVP